MPLFDSLTEIKRGRRRIQRRRFLTVSLAALGCYFGYRWWRFRPRAVAQRATQYVTPTELFYNVSIKPGFRPKIDINNWHLKVELEGRIRKYSYQQLKSRPSHRLFKTFVCIGNRLGGTSIGNAQWRGFPLAPLLSEVVPNPVDKLHVVFWGMDGFYSSVPFRVAGDPLVFVAYEMNDEPLPNRHGFPLRVLLPGKYGMKQPRWLDRIVITKEDESGYWERRGWSDEGEVQITARIDSAVEKVHGRWLLSGVAFCGASPVGIVEVSTDGGEHWSAACMSSENRPDTWSTWQYEWLPQAAGDHVLAVRAQAADGTPQIESYSGNFPSGATGLHRVVVTV
jgi:DMSO/TMAO reductase YedYZ molybdopterin-dependent catalytic subunit